MFDRIYISEIESSIGKRVNLAGWVTRTRDLKNIRFIVLRDKTGEIQVVVKSDSPEIFELNFNR
jgi:aspartyl-tRNA synthetase